MEKTSWLAHHRKALIWRSTMGAMGVWLLGGCGAPDAPAAADPVTTTSALTECHADNPNPALFPKNARPFGRSMESWAEQWWRWILSTPAEINPFLHPTMDSNQNQSGPVVFIVPGDRTNTIPRHKAILVTPSTLLNDYPCPDPTFHPAPGQSLFDFLLASVLPAQNGVVEVGATLDGQVLNDLLSYRVVSDDLMYFVGDLSLQTTLDNCITGSPQPAVVEAFIFMVKPLPPGRHVLTTRVVNSAGQVFVHTQNLDVQ